MTKQIGFCYHIIMTILDVFTRFGKLSIRYPGLSDRVIEEFGRQPKRNPVDAVLLSVWMDNEEGVPGASELFDEMIEYFEGRNDLS